MTLRLYLFSFIIIFVSCGQRETSAIEIIKFDRKLIDTLKATSDTSYSTLIGRHDFYSAEFYILKKDSFIVKILRDSLGNVVGLNKSKNGVTVFAAEYYPNGQLVAKTQFKPGMIDGPSVYYYSSGRIRSKGQWHNYTQVGTWKNFSEDGKLQTIVYYDSSGNIFKTDSIK